MTPVIAHKEGVSDDMYTVVDIYVSTGEMIEKGDLLFCYETSKTSIDIEAPESGFVHFTISKNDKIEAGQEIAIISDSKEIPATLLKKNIAETKQQNENIKISKAANALIEKHKVDITVFKEKTIINTEDVQQYLHQSQPNPFKEMTFDKDDVIIYGGGGHAKMCIEIVSQSKEYSVKGIIDDNLPISETVFGIPVIGTGLDIDHFIVNGLQKAIVGVGAILNRSVKNKIFNLLKSKHLEIPTIIHPTAMVEPSVILGEGNQVMQGAIVGSEVKVGDNCILNSGSIISHDTLIGDNTHITPGAIIAGGVSIGNNSVVGMGTTVFLGVKIGDNVIIPNGMDVFSDIVSNTVIKYQKS